MMKTIKNKNRQSCHKQPYENTCYFKQKNHLIVLYEMIKVFFFLLVILTALIHQRNQDYFP